MGLPLLLALALLQDAPAAPPPAEAPPPPISDFFPARALRLEIEGHVLLTCKATAEGRVADCVVTEETPPGYEFGDAALRMSVHFRMKPASRDGSTVAGKTVRVPLAFRFPDARLTAGLTKDEALACHGYWSSKVRFYTVGGPSYMAFLFANEVKWQARRAGESESDIEGRLAAARMATPKRAPMPAKCALPEEG